MFTAGWKRPARGASSGSGSWAVSSPHCGGSAGTTVHTHQGLWEAVATGLGQPLAGDGLEHGPAREFRKYYGEAEELVHAWARHCFRRAILRNTAFAAISADIERQWRALGVGPERLIRMASGVDAAHFHPPARTCARPSGTGAGAGLPRPRVIFTGRLHPQKNLDTLLDAWPTVVRRTGAHLILVGQGPDRARLEARAASLGVAAHIEFAGPVADPAPLLRAADAFASSVAEGRTHPLREKQRGETAGPSRLDMGGHAEGGAQTRADPGCWITRIRFARGRRTTAGQRRNRSLRVKPADEGTRAGAYGAGPLGLRCSCGVEVGRIDSSPSVRRRDPGAAAGTEIAANATSCRRICSG